MLYLLGASARSESGYTRPSKTLAASDVDCDGTETSLQLCPKTTYNYTDGNSIIGSLASVAAAYCEPLPEPPTPLVCDVDPTELSPTDKGECASGEVQLTGANGGKSSEGRIEYCYGRQWSPFCSIDSNTASVACQQMNYLSFTCTY